MKVEYPDLYKKTDCGDGLIQYNENGMIYYKQDGKDMEECKRCGELDFEDKMNWDKLCSNCQEHERTCFYCGEYFPGEDELTKDDDGRRICPDCVEINAELNQIKEISEKSHELYQKGVLSINPINNTVQLMPAAFAKLFKKYTIAPRGTVEYPVQMEAEADGLKFIALLTPEEQAKLKEAV